MNFMNVISSPLQVGHCTINNDFCLQTLGERLTENVDSCVTNLETLLGKEVSATNVARLVTAMFNVSNNDPSNQSAALIDATPLPWNGKILAEALKRLVSWCFQYTLEICRIAVTRFELVGSCRRIWFGSVFQRPQRACIAILDWHLHVRQTVPNWKAVHAMGNKQRRALFVAHSNHKQPVSLQHLRLSTLARQHSMFEDYARRSRPFVDGVALFGIGGGVVSSRREHQPFSNHLSTLPHSRPNQ